MKFLPTVAAAAAIAAASVVVALPWHVRRTVTDARAQRRIVKILECGSDSIGEYVSFVGGTFADHPGQLSVRAESGGPLVILGPPILGTRTRRYVTAGDLQMIRRDLRGQFSGFLGEDPSDFGLSYRAVDIDGLPAWEIPPGTPGRSVWVIHVHGLGSSRQQCLRGVAAFERMGFTSLIATYRSSLDLGKHAATRSDLGLSEWHDIAAAADYAVRHGASSVIFVGWSLGASIVLRAANEAPTIPVVGAVLVSPALDWPTIIDAALRRSGVPRWLRRWAVMAFDLFKDPASQRIRWENMPATSSFTDPPFPTLVFHGSADQSVPVDCSRGYSARHSQKVRYYEFEDAHHTLEWNAAPSTWEQAVQDWCRSIGLVQDNRPTVHALEGK
ncbi:alpha/beta hydrolase family protein [Arthrobacter sp. MDT3-44]